MHVAISEPSGATGLLLTERAVALGHTGDRAGSPPGRVPPPRPPPASRPSKAAPSTSPPSPAPSPAPTPSLNALGAHSPFRQENVLERAVPIIVQAMQSTLATSHPTRRIIVLGSAGALPTALDKQPAWRRWLVRKLLYTTVLKYPVASQVFQYQALAASGLDWTMAMPPMLTNSPAPRPLPPRPQSPAPRTAPASPAPT